MVRFRNYILIIYIIVLLLISLWFVSFKYNIVIGVMYVFNIGKFLGDFIFIYILIVND